MGEPFGWLSPAFRPVAFTLRFRTILRTYRHHFLFAQADVVRPRAWDARPPASCGETEPPDADFLRPDPVVALISEPFARVLADFSRVRFSSPVARLSPRGSQGHTGQVTILARSPAACSGLHATPANFAWQRFLTAFRPASGSQLAKRFPGYAGGTSPPTFALAYRLPPPDEAALSRAPALCRASFSLRSHGEPSDHLFHWG